MDLVVVLVGLCEALFGPKKIAEATRGAGFKVIVHLDGIEGADFDADLAAHADRDIDVESLGIELRLTDSVRLFVGALLDEDALRRALFFADKAGDAAQAGLRVRTVIDEKREVARGFDAGGALFGVLDGGKAIFIDVAAEKVSGCLC